MNSQFKLKNQWKNVRISGNLVLRSLDHGPTAKNLFFDAPIGKPNNFLTSMLLEILHENLKVCQSLELHIKQISGFICLNNFVTINVTEARISTPGQSWAV